MVLVVVVVVVVVVSETPTRHPCHLWGAAPELPLGAGRPNAGSAWIERG